MYIGTEGDRLGETEKSGVPILFIEEELAFL